MSKPVLQVLLTSTDRKTKRVLALVDSGSFYTIVRPEALPSRGAVLPRKSPESLGTAQKGGAIRIVAETVLVVSIGRKKVRTYALVSPDLSRDMVIGAVTMQEWDIGIRNRNGATRVVVGRDMRDPEITEVD